MVTGINLTAEENDSFQEFNYMCNTKPAHTMSPNGGDETIYHHAFTNVRASEMNEALLFLPYLRCQ